MEMKRKRRLGGGVEHYNFKNMWKKKAEKGKFTCKVRLEGLKDQLVRFSCRLKLDPLSS
jgi:hypothetical protein